MDAPGKITCQVIEVSLYNFFPHQRRVLWQVIHTAVSDRTTCFIIGTLSDEDLTVFHNAAHEIQAGILAAEHTLCALDLRLRQRHPILRLLFENGGWDANYEFKIGEAGLVWEGRRVSGDARQTNTRPRRAAMFLHSLCHIENASNVQIGNFNVNVGAEVNGAANVTWFTGLEVLIETGGLRYQYPRSSDVASVSLSELFVTKEVQITHGNVKLPPILVIIPVFEIAFLNEACIWNRACEEFFAAFHKKVYGRFNGTPQRFLRMGKVTASSPYPQFPAFPPFLLECHVSRSEADACLLSLYPLVKTTDADAILGMIDVTSVRLSGQTIWPLDVTELNERLRNEGEETSCLTLNGQHTLYVVNFLPCLQMLFRRYQVKDRRDICGLLEVISPAAKKFVLWLHNRLMTVALTVSAECGLDWIFMNGPFICVQCCGDDATQVRGGVLDMTIGRGTGNTWNVINPSPFSTKAVSLFRAKLVSTLTSLDLGPISGAIVVDKLSFVRVSTSHSAFFSAYDRIYYSTVDDIWGNPAAICNWLMLIPFLLNNTGNSDPLKRRRLSRVILKILFSQRKNTKFWTFPEDMASWFTDLPRAATFGLMKSDDLIISTMGLLYWKKGCNGTTSLNYARYVEEIRTWIALILGTIDEDTELMQGIPLLYLV